MNQRGKSVLPIFTTRKRPRQAVIAHPKDRTLLGSTTSEQSPEDTNVKRMSLAEDYHHPYKGVSGISHPYGRKNIGIDSHTRTPSVTEGRQQGMYRDEPMQSPYSKMPSDSHSGLPTTLTPPPQTSYYQDRPQGTSRSVEYYDTYLASPYGQSSTYGSPGSGSCPNSEQSWPDNPQVPLQRYDYSRPLGRGHALSGSSNPPGRAGRNNLPATPSPRLVLPNPRSSSRATTPKQALTPTSTKASPNKTTTSRNTTSSKVSKNRFLSASIGGMKHWSQYRYVAPLLFEIYGFVQGSVENGDDSVSKIFKLRDKKGSSVRCQFWEMEGPLLPLTPGKPYRCVGTLDHRTETFKCVKIRQATPMEVDTQLRRVAISDQSMKTCLIYEREP
ncbi:spermatogenesis-associated protein 22-like [Corticium candelabrum]|uniref:spermatogenesis-associated protein 22-like n=1 Tax=Corticium candelabrum TaxID=121492 RepID=UPI002E25FC6F|nr:spermatogenesis-associated protein 22-like [Corticium candelabrum]